MNFFFPHRHKNHHPSYQDDTTNYDANGKKIPLLGLLDSSLNVHLESMHIVEHNFHVKKNDA